jgi:hypothetical protein
MSWRINRPCAHSLNGLARSPRLILIFHLSGQRGPKHNCSAILLLISAEWAELKSAQLVNLVC